MALNKSFFATLPSLKQVPKSDADIAWIIYDLELITEKDQELGRYSLKKVDEVFTEFEPALLSITTPSPGKVEDFIKLLQEKFDEQLETPPVNKIIGRPF
ncbi:MAG: NotI family restriction endonuclease [archaeon]|nr:NotI family restriction endonuclease [archaeon]